MDSTIYSLLNNKIKATASGISNIEATGTGLKFTTVNSGIINVTIPANHIHSNLATILEKFTLDTNNKLLFNGQPISGTVDLSNYYNKTEIDDAFSTKIHTHVISDITDINITNPTDAQELKYDNSTSKWINKDSSSSDERVKLTSASATSDYLGNLIDNSTIQISNNKIVAKSLEGQIVTLSELNFISGLDENIMTKFSNFINGGIELYNGVFTTYSNLLAFNFTTLSSGKSYIVYVATDEQHGGDGTTYICNNTTNNSSQLPYYSGLSSATQRDLSVNKVDLTSEVKNILPKVNMDLTGIVKTSDLGDYETISDLQTNYATKSSVSAKINTIDIVDNLNSTEIYKPLSANQGNIINGILNNKLEVTDIEAGTNVSLNVVGNKVTINSTGGGTELTEEQESKINGIITNGDGTKVKTDDGTYKTINNNINKSIIINSSDWALDNSTNTYKVTITHGLKTKNIIPVMYDGDEDAGLLGYRRIGIDNIMLENDTAISGELIVNCSSSLDVEKETIIVSATSPLAKYTSLETCFSTETEGEKTISLLKETYDVLNTGLHMKKGWTLKGIAPDSTKIIMHTDGGHTIQQWVDGFFATVDCTIQDLTIESYNNDVYCIHADANNNTDEFDIWIKNCILRRTKDTLAPFINNTNGGQALGIGMTSGQRIHVYDSQIIACPITDIITSASINMHNWADNGGGKPSLFDFKNCTIIGGTYAGLVTNFRTSSDNIRDTIIFDNCNIEGGLMIEGNNYSQNAFIWNVNSECPRMKTFNGTCQSFPLSNGRKYLKNIGISNIVKGDAVCYVYQSKQYSWHQIGTFIMTPTGIEKLNASNKDYFAGFALNNCTINNYGYIQTKDLVFSNTNASTLFSYLIVDSSGTLVVDNTSPHYIGQTVGNSAGENLIKLKN